MDRDRLRGLLSAVNLAGEVIHVAIPRERTGARVPGVRLHRLARLDERVQWNLSPPRVRFEDALLMLCAAALTRSQALALIADACQRRRTTPARLQAALAGRARMRHREWLRGVLADLQDGVRSVLEAAYLRKVERAHGLPRGRRQRRRGPSTGWCTATWSTTGSRCWSSWTAGSGTTCPRTAGTTWTATCSPPSTRC